MKSTIQSLFGKSLIKLNFGDGGLFQGFKTSFQGI